MSKPLNYIFKIHSSRLRKAKWQLDLTFEEATANDEIVSIADSTALRFIRELENKSKGQSNENRLVMLINEMNQLKLMPATMENRRKMQKYNQEMHKLLFVKSYICIVIDSNKDYDRMNSTKGFYINGLRYKRLLATTGGAKKSTVVFVSSDLYEELNKKINNGRCPDKRLVPAKLEAYKALTCSASKAVSNPLGVLVIPDCITTFSAKII
ncbi:MAG: hypothetical protein K0Q73_5660, partial [Paenibacillus sp.]|nr:hypothetical protein [Paenibacillus sp.]